MVCIYVVNEGGIRGPVNARDWSGCEGWVDHGILAD
jgi:hypothetical protein